MVDSVDPAIDSARVVQLYRAEGEMMRALENLDSLGLALSAARLQAVLDLLQAEWQQIIQTA